MPQPPPGAPAEVSSRRADAELEATIHERTVSLEAATRALKAEIARRAQIEAALRASEQQLAIVADSLPAAALPSAVREEVAQRVEAEQARRSLLRQIMVAQEEERLRIARDLHDQLGQQITGLQLGLKQLEEHAGDGPLQPLIASLQALAIQMAQETHRLAVNLRPTALDDVGLIPALERLVADWGDQAGVTAVFASHGLGERRLPPEVEVVLYRVVQEALTNVRRHAAARAVAVLVKRHADEVVAIVEDDGRGCDPKAVLAGAGPRLGVLGMRERVAQVGGTLELESAPRRGTTIFVRMPLGVAFDAGGTPES